MSKESAMAALTGSPVTTPINPSLITGQGGVSGGGSPEVASEAPTISSPDASRIAAFAKKESKLQAEREQFKKEREEAQKILKDREELLALRKTDPVAAMRKEGYTDAEIFNFMAASEKTEPTPEEKARSAAQEEIEKFKQQTAAQAQAAEQERNQALIGKLKTDIGETIKADGEKYKACTMRGPMAEELIYETIVKVLETEQKLISPGEAADLVESYYREDAEAMANLLKPKAEAIAEAKEKIAEVQTTKVKTLTNQVTPTVASSANKRETREEKRARLENALRMGLKL